MSVCLYMCMYVYMYVHVCREAGRQACMYAGADLRLLRRGGLGGGGSGPEFFKGGGGLGSKSAGIFIYWQAKRNLGGGVNPPNPPLDPPLVCIFINFD